MSEKTKIDWCDSTINFVSGCEKISPGCTNCYITSTAPFRVSGRKHGDDPVIHESAFALACKLNNKPWVCDKCGHSQIFMINPTGCEECNGKTHRRRIFALSLSDWLWDRIPVPVLARVFDTMRVCDEVDWLLCTKRPEAFFDRMYKVLDYIEDNALFHWFSNWLDLDEKAPKHIRIGTTVENQAMADKRVQELLKIPAAVRFLSVEPMLEDINLTLTKPVPLYDAEYGDQHEYAERKAIDWVIVGGESGSLARPCNISWIRSIKDQCAAANVACFVKQMGSRPYYRVRGNPSIMEPNGTSEPVWLKLNHTKGGDPAEWPEDLRVRQWPESRR